MVLAPYGSAAHCVCVRACVCVCVYVCVCVSAAERVEVLQSDVQTGLIAVRYVPIVCDVV